MTVNETDSKVLVKGHDTRCSGPVCPARKSWRHSRPSMSAIESGRRPKPCGAGEGDPGNAAPHGSKGGRGLSADTRWVACGAGNVAPSQPSIDLLKHVLTGCHMTGGGSRLRRV